MGNYTMRVGLLQGLQTMAQIRQALGNSDFVNMTPPCGEERVITILTTEENAEKLAARGCKTEPAPQEI